MTNSSQLSFHGSLLPRHWHTHMARLPPGRLYPPFEPPSVAAQQLSVTLPGPTAISHPASPLFTTRPQTKAALPPFRNQCAREAFFFFLFLSLSLSKDPRCDNSLVARLPFFYRLELRMAQTVGALHRRSIAETNNSSNRRRHAILHRVVAFFLFAFFILPRPPRSFARLRL